MTLLIEEARALKKTRQFLLTLGTDTRWRPGWRELREAALRLLRHYPADFRVDEVWPK